MAKLTIEQISAEVAAKNFKLIDASQYQNIKTPIMIECDKGHQIETNMFSFRKSTFRCPICHGEEITINSAPPEKVGYRIIGIDNATQNMGISIFDDGKLVYYSLIKFSGKEFEDRLVRINDVVTKVIIGNWKPDYIVFEDIQYQNNYATYKKLAMLLGILIVAAKSHNVDYEITAPTVWRSHYQITGQRSSAKNQAINLIATMYNINVVDDIAEAILIGKYIVDKKLALMTLKKAF